jgi:hypothetical protein
MAHINNIGASIYTRIDYVPGSLTTGNRANPAQLIGKFESSAPTDTTAAALVSTAGEVPVAIEGIREFPSLGTPSNIVNVPQYGQSISSQIQGQADAPSLEFTFNYIPTNHFTLDALRKSGQNLVFRVRLSNTEDGGVQASPAEPSTSPAEYEDIFFQGTIASFEIVPALTDATQANIALTIDGDFEGPYSYVVVAGTPTYQLPSA